MPDRPAPVDELLEWLKQTGFDVSTDRYSPESFGNQILIVERGIFAVRMVKDRSIWSVDIAGPHTVTTEGGSFWFSLGVWQAYLDQTDPPTEAMPLDQMTTFVKDRRQDVEAAFEDDGELDVHLRAIRKEGAEARRRLSST